MLSLTGCGELLEKPDSTEKPKPYDATSLKKTELKKLKELFPRDWNAPERGQHPASTEMRLLKRITGKKRKIEQHVHFPDSPETQTTRSSSTFLDPSGKYIVGKDWNHDPDRKESTRFILYYDETMECFRGLSWTKSSLGEGNPVQMVGKFVKGKAVIEWKAFEESVGVDTKSHLFLTSPENFIWRVERIREGRIVTTLTSNSTLEQEWP
ncbi:MAG: hypothetical protein HN467_01015 [Opitutae bacterium]|nr:hypothetical protein [Opitutae bacterium]